MQSSYFAQNQRRVAVSVTVCFFCTMLLLYLVVVARKEHNEDDHDLVVVHRASSSSADDGAEKTKYDPALVREVLASCRKRMHTLLSSSFSSSPQCCQKRQDFIFDLDKPRQPDEELFCHCPKSKSGASSIPEFPDLMAAHKQQEQRNLFSRSLFEKTARALHGIFTTYDADPASPTTLPAFGTMCVGVDCGGIPVMLQSLRIGIGHVIVSVNTDSPKWTAFFTALAELFPRRFTAFLRPEKLSCAESWNLVARMAFSIRPMPEQVFIANADWAPRSTGRIRSELGIDNSMAHFAWWSRTVLDLPVNGFTGFSAFSFTQTGYRELGYFDEVLFPALSEDIEFHLRAVSKGLPRLGHYPHGALATIHTVRKSAGDRAVARREGRMARGHYIWLKWRVRLYNTGTPDFSQTEPFLHPFGIPELRHNNSWAVDDAHRLCLRTGKGKRYQQTDPSKPSKCFFNMNALKEKGLLPSDYEFASEQLSDEDIYGRYAG